MSLPKHHKPNPSSAIPYIAAILILTFFLILVAPNKQFFNATFLCGIFGQSSKSQAM